MPMAVEVRMHDELVNNAAALRAWDAKDIGEALVQAVDRIRRRATLSPWPPISGDKKMRRALRRNRDE